jgi:hypothetical protein
LALASVFVLLGEWIIGSDWKPVSKAANEARRGMWSHTSRLAEFPREPKKAFSSKGFDEFQGVSGVSKAAMEWDCTLRFYSA